ncbi:hypothetical protein BP6252_03812 [Coleophoma cylindrospora]|uniref:Glycoside hydrolase subgroup catalytic core n=1 Tax=Coleophoma cylindrospora TaxID=1849047 RepID=A0A3D8S8X9_9HELO|nr:hypothetical protein BP6252_03812 [Coleophoma cylindrospora]
MLKLSLVASALAGAVAAISNELAAELGYPAGVDVWCGKAYRASNASFEPGGWLETPVLSTTPLLDLSIQPRMNLYLDGEDYASLIVNAPISYMNGKSFVNSTFNKQDNLTSPFTILFVDIQTSETGVDLVSHANVTINSTANEFVFSLASFTPRLEPYEIVITGAAGDGAQFYTATTELYYLPKRTDGGSVTKVDNLYGGLLVQDYLTNSTEWTSIFPYTYYVSWDGWLDLSTDNLKVFKDQGFNIIHIVPNEALPNEAFNFTQLDSFLDIMDEMELWLMFDMRWTYTNTSWVEQQVQMVNARKSMLLWYTGDEPDGHVDPLNATKITYDLIKSIDPYHPVSICLNCLNYYFEEYTSGADIIMSDPYPISVNTSWSTQYDTACNTTYGCCGCDDCDGTFEDVSNRLDLYTEYQEILGLAQKPQWGVPQAFGNETFWSRYPTPEEEIVMNMLFINHGAKGIAMWDYPTEAGIANTTGALSRVLTKPAITSFLLGSFVQALPVAGEERIDVASWTVGSQMLVSVVSKDYVPAPSANVTIAMPAGVKATGLSELLWGSGWVVAGGMLYKTGVEALEVDMFVLDLA